MKNLKQDTYNMKQNNIIAYCCNFCFKKNDRTRVFKGQMDILSLFWCTGIYAYVHRDVKIY